MVATQGTPSGGASPPERRAPNNSIPFPRTSIFNNFANQKLFGSLTVDQIPLAFSRHSQVDDEIQEAYDKDAGLGIFSKTKREKCASFVNGCWNFFRPDFILKHLNFQSFVTVTRSWIVVFIGLILMSIQPVIEWLDEEAYLLLVTPCLEATGGMSTSHVFYSALTDLIIVLFGFATNIIAYAISWRIRGYPTMESTIRDLAAEGICTLGDMECLEYEKWSGRFLTTKTTVIMIFGMISALIMIGSIQIKIPTLGPAWTLGAMATVMTGIYFNFTPYFKPWEMGRSVILCMGLSFSTRLVVALFWFPSSANFKFFSIINESLKAMQATMEVSLSPLLEMDPSDDQFEPTLDKFKDHMNKILAKYASLEMEGMLSRWEFAYSRIDPGDLGEFRSLIRGIVNSFSGCRLYFDFILDKKKSIINHKAKAASLKSESVGDIDQSVDSLESTDVVSSGSESTNKPKPQNNMMINFPGFAEAVPAVFAERFQDIAALNDKLLDITKLNALTDENNNKDTGNFESQQQAQAEAKNWDNMEFTDLDHLHKLIMGHYCGLVSSIQDTVTTMVGWGHEAHKFRILSIFPGQRKKRIERQKEYAEKITRSLESLTHEFETKQNSSYQAWVQSNCHDEVFKSREHYLFSLGLDSFYGSALERVSRNVQRAGNYCMFIDDTMPTPQFVYPFMTTAAKKPHFEKEYHARGVLGLDMDSIPSAHQPMSNTHRRDPDSLPTRTALHILGHQLQQFWGLLTDPRSLYVIKRALVTVASCFTFFSRTSAYFSYEYRMAWVPSMVALTVSSKAVDGIYGVLVKVTFSGIGAVGGLVAWYAGNGHGRGNHYGYVAALGFVLFFMIAYRHFNSLSVPMGPIVMCTTACTVAGISWVDARIHPDDINLRWGWHVVWIRFVAVVIGLLISFIATILPRPLTAKREIRLVLGEALETFGDCQASTVNFAMHRHRDPSVHYRSRQDVIIQKLRAVKVNAINAGGLAKRIRFEPPLSGVWPRHKYELLIKLVTEMAFLLEDVYFFFDDVKHSQDMPMLLRLMGWTDIDITSSLYSVLTMCSRSLSMAEPLPSLTPGYMTDRYATHLKALLEASTKQMNVDLETFLEDKYVTHDGRLGLAMILTTSALYKRADACVRIIKDLVGEIYDVDISIYEYSENTPLMWSSQLASSRSKNSEKEKL